MPCQKDLHLSVILCGQVWSAVLRVSVSLLWHVSKEHHCLEYAPYFTLERENDRNTGTQSLEDEKANTIKTVVFELTSLWHVTTVSTETSPWCTLWTTFTSKIKIKHQDSLCLDKICSAWHWAVSHYFAYRWPGRGFQKIDFCLLSYVSLQWINKVWRTLTSLKISFCSHSLPSNYFISQ